MKSEIYSLESKIGNYDILRKQMIELEIQYRDLLVTKSESEGHVRSRINEAANQNGDMRGQVEKVKEQIHLLQLRNNQVTSDIKRQRTINQAR